MARHAFVGIAHHFRNYYSELQLHAIENCVPFIVNNSTEEADCLRYAESLEPAFREFQPDLIFIIYRSVLFIEKLKDEYSRAFWGYFLEYFLELSIKFYQHYLNLIQNLRFPETEAPFESLNDPILLGMQSLYSLANAYATELVFMPAVEVRFRIFQPMDVILDALRVGWPPLTRLRMSRLVGFLVYLNSRY